MVEVIRNKDNKTRQYPILIFGGFLMLADAWHTLYAGVRQHRLATTGIYARIRHPQYVAFFI